jgi:glutamate N-acetyltransferase/amino-acid N-acetyltransferase
MIPRGFSFSAINVGIKSPAYTKLDLGLVACTTDVALSGVFTRNLVKAAPVLIGMEQVKRGSARAVIANAGNANACTGSIGVSDARAMMEAVARELKVSPDEVVPCPPAPSACICPRSGSSRRSPAGEGIVAGP